MDYTALTVTCFRNKSTPEIHHRKLITEVLAPDLGGNWMNWKMWTLLELDRFHGDGNADQNDASHGECSIALPVLGQTWGMPSYLQNHQVDIVIACCTLHNFIRRYSNDDIIFNEPDEDTPPDMDSFYHRGHPTTSELEAQRTLRDNIALQMWAAHHPNNPQ
ncbi:uncharacterized protein LOC105158214 isoform X1 [Sesamum indicum]|uniref:Uncharacterized protein LOC105158214 isoform X1 n=1 Tax=Sesamum indicum TaxID=4182 RepID=A0A6I9SSE7_SESIN|nr:uncharacterized protein LOC105158214 isoform X1 [Sesamum indicum]